MYFSTPKFTAQGLRKVKETNWTPLQFLASPTNSVKTVLEPAGFENAQGIMTTQFTKQAGDPAWANDPEVNEYVEFMKKWVPNDNPGDFVALSGYINVARHRPCDQAVRRRPDARKSSEAGDQPEGAALQNDAARRSAQHHATGLCALSIAAHGEVRRLFLEADRRGRNVSVSEMMAAGAPAGNISPLVNLGRGDRFAL